MFKLLNDPFFSTFLDTQRTISFPQSKVEKTNEGYTLFLAVPGLTKNDLKIVVENGELSISCDEKSSSKFLGGFTKAYTLPESVDENSIEGKVENGVLILSVPVHQRKLNQKLISLN